MKSIILNAAADGGWNSRFQAALDVARAFEGHLGCVQATPIIAGGVGLPVGYFPFPEIAQQFEDAAQQHRASVEAQLRGESISWDWQHFSGDPAQSLVEQSGLADLIVLSSATASGDPGQVALGLAGTVAIHARGPILTVPATLERFDPLGVAIVAWNGSLEGANAVRLSLPMLRKARSVYILSVTEETDRSGFPATDASEYLARHDISSELHCWDRADTSIAQVILQAAATLHADYIVAGAYGHSRFREAVLGGVTRELLAGSEVPLVLAH